MSITKSPVIAEADGRRLKLLALTEPQLVKVTTPHGVKAREFITSCGVPEDVGVVGIQHDQIRGMVWVLLTHRGYQLVPWGAEAPLHRPGDAALIPAS